MLVDLEKYSLRELQTEHNILKRARFTNMDNSSLTYLFRVQILTNEEFGHDKSWDQFQKFVNVYYFLVSHITTTSFKFWNIHLTHLFQILEIVYFWPYILRFRNFE